MTAPEISAAFAQCLANYVAALDIDGGAPAVVLELGAGTGTLAADLLLALERRDALPTRYDILDVSGDLRARQRVTLAERAPHLADRVRWLDTLPDKSFSGLVLANEVLDALPVTRFRIAADGAPHALGVTRSGDGFAWAPGPALGTTAEGVAGLPATLPPGYASEICPGVAGLVASLAAVLERGLALFIDYGAVRNDYYRADRTDGTLVCHYRHRAHDDPFLWPGLQDISAWVDFTRVAEAATAASLDVVGFTTQSRFMLDHGVEDVARDALVAADAETRLRVSRELQTLMMPGQMGETFKVMAVGRGVEGGDFGRADLAHLL